MDTIEDPSWSIPKVLVFWFKNTNQVFQVNYFSLWKGSDAHILIEAVARVSTKKSVWKQFIVIFVLSLFAI